MRTHRPILSFFIAQLFLLSGCTTSLQELQKISPIASNFSSSLAAEYLAYSESEAEQGRESSAEYFASKGVDAAKGKIVEPDAVAMGTNNYKALFISRLALVDILNEDVKRVAPQKAARAKMLFDCWNERENTKLSVAEAFCAEEFILVYNELQAVADDLVHGAESRHALQFTTDSVVLDDEAKNVVAEVAKHIEGHPDYVLELNAHHDALDKKTNQGRLAHKRLVAVRRAIIKAGVAKEKIFFTKPDLARASGSAVLLSNDEMMQDSDEVDIIITSSRHQSVVSP